MAWRRPSDKPLSEPMMISLPTHVCVTRPKWVKTSHYHCIILWAGDVSKALMNSWIQEVLKFELHLQIVSSNVWVRYFYGISKGPLKFHTKHFTYALKYVHLFRYENLRLLDLRAHKYFKMLSSLAWWRHQLDTFSAILAFCEGNSPVTGEFTSQRPVMQSFDVVVFFSICTWIKGWVTNCEACDLRRYRAHYDVTVVIFEMLL